VQSARGGGAREISFSVRNTLCLGGANNLKNEAAVEQKGGTQESMSLKYEPASEPLHISVKWLFVNCILVEQKGGARVRADVKDQNLVMTVLHVPSGLSYMCRD